MHITSRVARTAVVAGLGLSMAMGPLSVAFAADGADSPVPGEATPSSYSAQKSAESTGQTKLYVINEQDDLTTEEGSTDENVRVSIPVAIHYVADANGNLVGPSDNVVKFVNHAALGSVHVSKIAVQNAGKAKIKMDSNSLGPDEMSFFVQPAPGTSDANGESFAPAEDAGGTPLAGSIDQLGTYSAEAKTPTQKNDWDILQNNGALALNHLTGRIGGFNEVSAESDYQAGTVKWTVRAGTREQADTRDSTVTIRYSSNNGSLAGDVPIADQQVEVLDHTQMPTKVAIDASMEQSLAPGASSVTPPKAKRNADGTTTSYQFLGWSKNPNSTGATQDLVQKVGDLGTAEDLAGSVQQLYAIFGEAA